MGGGERPILFASHHAPCRASSISLWLPQCRRSDEYEIHMCARGALTGRWISAQWSADPARQQGGVLILRRHDDAEALEVAEILGERQGDAGTVVRVGGVDDGVLAEFGDVGDAGVLDAPQLFRDGSGIGRQRGLRIDPPAVHAVGRAGRAQVGHGRADPPRGRGAGSCRRGSSVAPGLNTLLIG